jgi:hypothetical protein
MNPIVSFLLSLIEGLLQTAGPAILADIQAEIAKLEEKYSGTTPPAK